MSLFITLELFLVIIAGVLMIAGNLMVNMIMLYVGMGLSIGAFFLSLLITIGSQEDNEVDDITFINALIYPLIVGIILTLGSFYDPIETDPAALQLANQNIQSVFLDMGLVMGLFIIFVFIWQLIKEKWDFVELEDQDFRSMADKDVMPRFLLVCIILGALYGGLFISFKILFYLTNYNITSYVFMGIIGVVCLLLSFLRFALDR